MSELFFLPLSNLQHTASTKGHLCSPPHVSLHSFRCLFEVFFFSYRLRLAYVCVWAHFPFHNLRSHKSSAPNGFWIQIQRWRLLWCCASWLPFPISASCAVVFRGSRAQMTVGFLWTWQLVMDFLGQKLTVTHDDVDPPAVKDGENPTGTFRKGKQSCLWWGN